MPRNLNRIPQIDALLQSPTIKEILEKYSVIEATDALRHILGTIRNNMLANADAGLPDFQGDTFSQLVVAKIEQMRAPNLRSVINATGIIIHTNLGRSPLAPSAVRAISDVACAASNLEFNFQTGKRGSRHDHVESQICRLTGAEAAVVVNNCAAAVLLSLVATSAGRSVVASRGELIEIGGSYRLPDVIIQSGAILREVGTTNKTRISDYENAIDATTSVLLKSHTSNFKIVGFTSKPARTDLAHLAAERGIILMEDLGSGVLIDLSPYGLKEEPVVSDIIKAGVDIVMFSGDKLLGGPQAGIIAGKRNIIALLKVHPLMRAVRIDKLSLAALEATLRLYGAPHDPLKEVPVLAILSEPLAVVEQRANRLLQAVAGATGLDVFVQDSTAQVGAGSVPEQDLASFALSCRIAGLSADELTAQLRGGVTPVIGRIEKNRVLLDMRTVRDHDVPTVAAALIQISGA
jgi:L-seryl-tRNA(Ser) seleniumtransferase